MGPLEGSLRRVPLQRILALNPPDMRRFKVLGFKVYGFRVCGLGV